MCPIGARPPARGRRLEGSGTLRERLLPAIELNLLDEASLLRIAAGEPVDLGSRAVPEGALPPPHVARRALETLESGTPARWCVPYLISDAKSGAIVGGCGFKWAPVSGRTEIGYGVARSARGKGIATAAVARLLELAAASGQVTHVAATILPGNIASTRVVCRLGFDMGHAFVAADGETLVYWSCPITP